jgi:hypothetical protein
MPLDVRTLGLMREAFAGQSCAVCQGPADRLLLGGFYCHDHAPPNCGGGRRVEVVRAREPKWERRQ